MQTSRPALAGAVTAFVAAAALGACQQSATGGNEAGATPTAAATDAPAVPASTANASLWNNGQSKPLDTQVAHPNGVVLQLTSLQSRATDTKVGIRVINGRERDADLNRFNSNRDGYLLLDTGEKLYLSPPATNTKLTVPAGQTFEGDLVFLGRLPAVKTAVLVLNENSSTSAQYTDQPGFRIDLPLAGTPAGATQ